MWNKRRREERWDEKSREGDAGEEDEEVMALLLLNFFP
jgi:hypothetical protein